MPSVEEMHESQVTLMRPCMTSALNFPALPSTYHYHPPTPHLPHPFHPLASSAASPSCSVSAMRVIPISSEWTKGSAIQDIYGREFYLHNARKRSAMRCWHVWKESARLRHLSNCNLPTAHHAMNRSPHSLPRLPRTLDDPLRFESSSEGGLSNRNECNPNKTGFIHCIRGASRGRHHRAHSSPVMSNDRKGECRYQITVLGPGKSLRKLDVSV
ncbi:hypothetical protein WG66_002544 [Moniliophthora roreri]|nr:hypothetical protein WG66_002544 [Moniliophthora roreri]